ncbi:carbon monoxide dehydrogenase E protein [Rubrivivax sp. A210]|uniref:vWA domain-containing protein n=1 Tax=Rubrivivax sp. A210 TaxID=2772301 RepID=UPI0019195ABA|nr:VWA domain-containing protein [Rubrivivax sp. A210]CAD5374268.1 carbon monoxide dehydrogenase E protein [Rubrivivax sp. A210]
MRLAAHITRFSRLLHAAGLQAGPDRVLTALAAVEAVGLERRDDVHAALAAVMLDHREQQAVFDAAFDAFWRAPGHAALASAPVSATEVSPSRRLAEALAVVQAGTLAKAPPAAPAAPEPPVHEAGTGFTARERLQRADFEQMTAAEYAWAQAQAARLPPPVAPVRQRRRGAAPRGRIDLRRTLQAMVRQPHTLLPRYTRPRQQLPPLVVLLDISGSMDRYARLFLHYIHGLMCRHLRVQAFTFGTRLTNITRCLRERDPDRALARVEAAVQDWKGGTRIAGALDAFHRDWSRRVLGARATVLLVSDGLDHDDSQRLGQVAARLRRTAHRVVWLNPLLRFAGFEPRAAGVRALLPHVDRFLPVHNLASLAGLAAALGTQGSPGRRAGPVCGPKGRP